MKKSVFLISVLAVLVIGTGCVATKTDPATVVPTKNVMKPAQKPAWVLRRHELQRKYGMWPHLSQAPGVIRYLNDQNPRYTHKWDNYTYDTPEMYLFHGGPKNWIPSTEDRSRLLSR